MRISDLKLGIRLGAAFGLMLLITVLIATLSVTRIVALKNSSETIATVELKRQALIQEWFTDIQMNWIRTEAIFKASNPQYIAKLENDIKAVVDTQTKRMEQVQLMIRAGEEKQLFDQAIAARDDYRKTRADLGKQRAAGQDVAELTDKTLAPVFQRYATAVNQLKEYAGRALTEEQKGSLEQASRSVQLVIGGAIASLLMGLFLSNWVTKSITKPIQQAVSAASSIAEGNLATPIPEGTKDETGQLLHELKEMQGKLASTVREVRSSADAVATASAEIATGNDDLSARTEQQASALEQTAASMEELGSTVKQNADNARTANQLAQKASTIATQGGEVVAEVVGTMKGINDSSRKIADIISVIDGIAFQTNILALNAAVEAARAGEQGRGFAVVASEVRSLAGRSAEAAKEIKNLISNSVERVEQGSALVDHAGITMQEVVNAIRQVTDLMGQITIASNEQAQGVAQVNEAISLLDQTTQQNAALVEQSASAAEGLKNQAEQLVQAVKVFR